MTSAICATTLAAIVLLDLAPAEAEEKGGPAKPALAEAPPDLVRLITCGAKVPEYNAFALDFSSHPERAVKWGWRKATTKSGFLEAYTLSSPITIFGQKTSRIAFSGSGIVAMLDIPVHELGKKLGLHVVVDNGSTVVLGKTVHASRETDKDSGTTFAETISLNVSTSSDVGGVTLAGCSYVIDVR
jgi:hypothetical protein